MTKSPQKNRKELSLRTKVGWIALAMLAAIIYGIIQYRTTGESALLELTRTGVMMALLWLAWPELEQLPRWLFAAIPITVVVCAWRPQLLFIVLPGTLFYLWLRPPKSRNKSKK